MNILDINKDEQLATLMLQQVPVIIANAATLGVDPADIDALSAAYSSFNTSIGAAATAKANAKATVTAKNKNKQSARALLRQYAKIWRASPAVSDQLLNQLFLAPKSTPGTQTPPTTPTGLTFSATGNGQITLRWKRNGNRQGTTFLIQTSDSASGEWNTFEATTKTSFVYNGTPGVAVWFRIIARRDGVSAAPTLPVSVWAGSGGNFLEVAA